MSILEVAAGVVLAYVVIQLGRWVVGIVREAFAVE
jgi:hypothetical protein